MLTRPRPRILLALALGAVALGAVALLSQPLRTHAQDPAVDALMAAARRGDLPAVQAAIDSGADVNSRTPYGATALFFACDRGHAELVDWLLEAGADPNLKDTFYQATPMTWAQSKGHRDILMKLYAAGGEGAGEALIQAVLSRNLDTCRELLQLENLPADALRRAQALAGRGSEELQAVLLPQLEARGLPAWQAPPELSPQQRQRLVGSYRNDRLNLEVVETEGTLRLQGLGPEPVELQRLDAEEFLAGNGSVSFAGPETAPAESLLLAISGRQFALPRAAAGTPATPAASDADGDDDDDDAPAAGQPLPTFVSRDLDVSSTNWPGFRGTEGRGIGDGQHPPVSWDGRPESTQGLRWKTPIPGLGLSCPVTWDDRIYLTTAVAEGDSGGLKIGLYGDVDSVEDDRDYEFRVLCLSRTTGEVLWDQVAHVGKPAVKRHAKSSHANPTVATNGEFVIAFFGSEGLFCYDRDGQLKWKRDLGLLDSGWFYDPDYQWGFGSSPVIAGDRVVIQCDIQGQSFVAALRLDNGEDIWRQDRDEIPTWSTPTVHTFGDLTMLITNGTHAARGYDLDTGELLWTLGGHSEIVVPVPNVARDLIFVASGYSPIQPIYAIHPNARGDLSLPEGESTSGAIQWSVKRGGPYMPSPLIYGDYLYCCSNSGILTCYQATSGREVYKRRLRAPGGSLSFTASPVAADGHLYLTAEDGRVLVIRAGETFELVATNACGESALATPAIAPGLFLLRTQQHLMAFGEEPR